MTGFRPLLHAGTAALTLALLSQTEAAAQASQPAGSGAILLGPLSVDAEAPDPAVQGYRAKRTRSATKTDAELRNVPQSVTVVTRSLIDDLDMQNMADVVRYVPGVSMGQGEGHRDAPTLRGNSSTADFFVNGVRDDVQYYRDLYNVDRVEVLKGPNAMIFGRGGGGGVINRVMKRADSGSLSAGTLEAGSRSHWRGEVDAGGAISDRIALRLAGMYENSDSYRRFFNVERYGINPMASLAIGAATTVDLSYEYYDDRRTVDRGIPSQNGRPFATGRASFFGNPELSYAPTDVHLARATIEHEFSPDVALRNQTLFGAYDKFYQNVFARNAVSAAGTLNLEAYHAGTQRENLFNQTDLTWKVATGSIGHTLLAGAEIGRQWTDNFRNNSSFNPVVSAFDPVNRLPVAFDIRNSDNQVDTTVVAFYAQDQIALTPQFDLIVGLRYDRFDLEFDNRLNSLSFERSDNLVSPRAGLVYRPVEALSLYGSYSISYLPSSGDQFSSLDATSAALKAEKFENFEIGAKLDITPSLAATLALYQLDRDNTRAPGPSGTVVLTGRQRSKGIELGLSGQVTESWQVLAGYALQKSEITSTTAAAPAGRQVPLVPRHSVSLWNKVQILPWLGAGIGLLHQDKVYAAITNAVTLPAFTRVDAGLFFTINEQLQAQLNVENLFDKKYFSSAHNDNNITPGAPTTIRVGLKARL